MKRFFPRSFVFFLATALVFALQAIPIIGIFLMFAMAPFWSVVLVNAGMLGTAAEAASGRASRAWLLLPLLFYGGYWLVAAQDHLKLRELGATYDEANARVATGFDPVRAALVFENEASGAAWLTQNTDLPVAYTVNPNYAEGYVSHRMMPQAVCAKVREAPSLAASSVRAFGFHDGESVWKSRMETRFCALSMPERPELPPARVTREETRIRVGTLPVTRVVTTIAMPDGRHYRLSGGFAAPLSWIPMPVVGCALNSGAARWDCDAGFWRKSFTPLLAGKGRYGRDTEALASALGLARVAVAARKGGDPAPVMAKIAAVEASTLARQLANVDAMVADPLVKDPDWQVGVVASRPEALESRADAIMLGVERAAAITGNDRYRARESGRILAGLLARLPRDRFVGFGPRLLALYARAEDEHWLWEAEDVLRRLGDLGPAALPSLLRPRASGPGVNGAGIEGLCRVGPPALAAARPALLEMWSRSGERGDRDRRDALYVAMRRIGIAPPPLAGSDSKALARLQADWADISPASPARVCATRAERQARREEQYGGKRRTNLD